MSTPSPELLATNHPMVIGLFWAALASYLLAFFFTWVRPAWGAWLLGAGSAAHLAAMIGRGWVISFFPLTNKFESFSAASLAVALVAIASWKEVRLYGAILIGAAIAFASAAMFLFPLDFSYPPPLMRTVWYPTHVPLSFLAYGIWIAAAAAGAVWMRDRDPEWLARVDKLALQGFGLWTIAMICGGWWGVVAWGAYFLWDPKVIWSVILWFHYASFIHIRLTPSLYSRPWIRPAMALLGVVWLVVAYIGTSFFFGKSSHAF
jgi:ABC-type transport system involved in cytochrome c biogenesis permease subunit